MHKYFDMNKCYVIAEAGVNHNGSEELALQLVEAAAKSGVDAVKFQTFKTEKLVSQYARTAEYQKLSTGEESQFDMLKKLEISFELHTKLIDKCEQLGIDFLSTPFDIELARYLLNLGMKRIKIASGELTNIPFIEKLAGFDVPMILSSGMSSLEEVKEAVNSIRRVRQDQKFERSLSEVLTILHCTSNYPAKYQDINLNAMQTMADELSIPVGYSDHTKGIFVSVSAVAMGANLIEKHFTLDKDLPGPDHQASLDPKELSEMVRQIRSIEQCLGDGVKIPTKSELPIRELVRRSVALAIDKKAGDVLKLSDLSLLRPGNGIAPVDIEKVVGRKLLSDCKLHKTLQWCDLV
jgi:N,N'-diacetyllegionaminate synthase